MKKLELVSREVFIEAPTATTILGRSYYTRREGLELAGEGDFIERSDTSEGVGRRYSNDNGQSWGEEQKYHTGQNMPNGVKRGRVFPGFVCPHTGRLVRLFNEAVLPTDSPNPREAGSLWRVKYTISEDGGRTETAQKYVQQEGDEFSPDHPLPAIWHGKNCIFKGALSTAPLSLDNGTFLVPFQCTLLDDKGELYFPTKGYGWFATCIVEGSWKSDGDIKWRQLAVVEGSTEYTTRGLFEGTLAQLDDDRLLLVMRGSNDADHQLPGHKWHCFSEDAGGTWSDPKPWTYDDKSTFYSPSSCSQFLPHSSGALLWIGNICKTNSAGNSPRFPLVIGEVDKSNGLLKEHSLCVIDDKADADHPSLQLSNFFAREDRKTAEVVLHCSRLAHASSQGWHTDALLYRITVGDSK